MSKIDSFTGDYRWLSSCWGASVKIGKLTFPSTENAYQAAKSLDPHDWQGIILYCLPYQAERVSQAFKLREDWDEIQYAVLAEVTAAKYEQHPELFNKLMATKDLELNDGTEENHLGKILMAYRDKQVTQQVTQS